MDCSGLEWMDCVVSKGQDHFCVFVCLHRKQAVTSVIKGTERSSVAFVAVILVVTDVSASAARQRSPVKNPWRRVAKGMLTALSVLVGGVGAQRKVPPAFAYGTCCPNCQHLTHFKSVVKLLIIL